MTADGFRSLALDVPDTEEGEHMGHADFRVRGKVFASLDAPKPGWGMVKLTPQQQGEFMREEPDVFVPAAGAWGARGATLVQLKGVGKAVLKRAIVAAWRNTAPKRLVEELGP